MGEGTEKRAGRLRRMLGIGCSSVLVGAGLLVGASLAWTLHKARRAERHVKKLCAQYPVGATVGDFESEARALGLAPRRWSDFDPISGETTVDYSAQGGVFLSGWTCSIQARDDTVVKASLDFED